MIEEIKVENFCGIERLEIKGLRRVNLITGKNDCGKTSLLEAMFAAWLGSIGGSQASRGLNADLADFDDYWRPIFRGGDAERGLLVELLSDGQLVRLEVRKAVKTATHLLTSSTGRRNAALKTNPGWTLEQRWEYNGARQQTIITARPSGEVEIPDVPSFRQGNWSFNYRSPEIGEVDCQRLSRLKQVGREGLVVELLRKINDDIRGIDLLAPTGKDAAIFVRLADGGPMLPIQMMGDGTQRCMEIALAFADENMQVMYLDEIENGLHHSTVDTLWRWIAAISAQRGVQVFATTHSEECIQAAARAFTELNDDGLCVVRLDRHKDKTTAALYDKSLVAATERMGIEIRG